MAEVSNTVILHQSIFVLQLLISQLLDFLLFWYNVADDSMSAKIFVSYVLNVLFHKCTVTFDVFTIHILFMSFVITVLQ